MGDAAAADAAFLLQSAANLLPLLLPLLLSLLLPLLLAGDQEQSCEQGSHAGRCRTCISQFEQHLLAAAGGSYGRHQLGLAHRLCCSSCSCCRTPYHRIQGLHDAPAAGWEREGSGPIKDRQEVGTQATKTPVLVLAGSVGMQLQHAGTPLGSSGALLLKAFCCSCKVPVPSRCPRCCCLMAPTAHHWQRCMPPRRPAAPVTAARPRG